MNTSRDIIDIIKNRRNELGLSQRELAKLVDISNSTLSRYESYDREFPINDLPRFARALNLDINFMLGVEYSNNNLEKRLLIDNYDKLDDDNRTKLVRYSTDLVDKSSIIEEAKLIPVAVTESAAAGTGYTYGDNEITYYYTDCTNLPSYDFATVIKGDSMEPTLTNGDIALIKQGYDNVNGDIYVIDYDGKSYIKKLYNDGDRFRLISINRNYENIIIDVPPEEDIYFNIIGKVVGSFTPIDPNNT